MTTTNTCDVTRRDFLKTTGAATAFATFFAVTNGDALTTGENSPDAATAATGQSIRYRYSVCQNCHARCGILAKVVGTAGSTDPAAGVLVKIEGNPYHPQNLGEDERLAWSNTPNSTTGEPSKFGRLCPKGQAGVQVLYDPYRIKHPLKKVGSRGSGKWQVVSWDTALTEIAAAIAAQIPVSTRFGQVNGSFARMGPAANQLMFSPGRLPDGEFTERIFKNTWGTTNFRLDHTSICETSHHVSNTLMTPGKNHWKPDILGADYLILFGVNYLEANFPMLSLARMISDYKKLGKTLVVVDPRFSNTASKANTWIAPKPGTDGAVALGMARRILDQNGPVTGLAAEEATRAITKYLRNANVQAANDDNETTYSDAARLVIVRNASGPSSAVVGEYLRVEDTTVVATDSSANYMAWPDGGGAPVEIRSAAVATHGQLIPGVVSFGGNGGGTLYCKTVYELLKDNAFSSSKTVQYYADIAGVDATVLTGVADAFYVKGKKAIANSYRGTVQHTNGTTAMQAVMLLNTLVGNYNWQGGNVAGGKGWDYTQGSSSSSTMRGEEAVKWTHTTYTALSLGNGPYGPRIDRSNLGTNYDYTKFNTDTGGGTAYPYPSTRPWFRHAYNGNYQEIIPSIAGQYPYAGKVLITYWNAFPYSVPALKNVFVSTVTDTAKVPVFVAIDNQMGETSSYADYILPDTTYLEKWSFPGSNAVTLARCTPFRQPVVGSFDSKAWDAGFVTTGTNTYNPIYPDTKMYEDILLGLMTKLGFTSVLSGSTGANGGTALPANAWAHFSPALTYLIGQANGSSPGNGWGSGLTEGDIVARGGVFQDPGYGYDTSTSGYNAGKVRYQYTDTSSTAGVVNLYYEPLATTVDSMGASSAVKWVASDSGDGTTTNKTYFAFAHDERITDIKGNSVSDSAYPFQLITYKKVLHGQARTQNLPWLTCWQPENFVELNSTDAASLGLKTYDLARITSPSNPGGITGRVWVTEGLRPGVVAVSHHFGHWAQSSAAWTQDSAAQPTASSRSLGIQPNQVMRLDPQLNDVSLQDRIGGSVSFYDTRVNVQKV